jgi:multiple sugar transport system substrate-binding protein
MQPTLSRRNFLKATATVLGSTFLVACVAPPAAPAGTEPSAPAEAPGSQGEVTMVAFPLTQDDVALMRPIQDAFMEANPGITVQVQIDPWDGRENKMLAALAAGNPPNAVYLNPDFYPKFVESDVLVAFNDLLAEGFMDDYLPGPISAVQYNDNIFGLPPRPITSSLSRRQALPRRLRIGRHSARPLSKCITQMQAFGARPMT